MANSTAKQSGRSKASGQKQKQPPIRIDDQEQGRAQPGRQQYGDHQSNSGRQQSAELNDSQQNYGSSSRQQGGDQTRQQGRNLPEGNSQDYSQNSDREQPSQQQQGLAAEKWKAEWQQQVGNAKVLWGKLTDDEILKTEGRADKLAGLVRERYALSQEAADAQVKKFLRDSGYY